MARGGQQGDPTDWVTRAADDAIRHAGEERPGRSPARRAPARPARCTSATCASSSPSTSSPTSCGAAACPSGTCTCGTTTTGSARCRPASTRPGPSTSAGRSPRSPTRGSATPSWAEHFKAPLRDALHELGVDMEEISQTERYTRASTASRCCTPYAHRDEIDAVLAQYRTKARVAESEQEAEELADSVADDEDVDTGPAAGLERFPFKPYCRECGRDTTHITAYDDETTDLAYTCQSAAFTGVTNLATQNEGKLVWKVDWPMRWAFEHVDFEPAGMDHATPGSSFTVGHELVETVFGMPRPAWFGYGFVGFAGRAEDVVLDGRRADRGRRAAGARGADPALALRAPAARSRPSTSTSAPRWCGCTTSGTRSAARPPTRRSGTARCSPTSGPPRPRPPARCRRRRSSCRSGRSSSVADVTAGSAELISRVDRARRPRALLGDRPRAAAVAGDGLDARSSCRRRTGRSSGPSPTPSGSPSLSEREAQLAAAAARRAARDARRARPRRRSPRWSTAYPSSPSACRSTPTRPTRSRRTRRSSSGCSTTCSSTRTAARACPTLIVALGPDRIRTLLTQPVGVRLRLRLRRAPARTRWRGMTKNSTQTKPAAIATTRHQHRLGHRVAERHECLGGSPADCRSPPATR